MTRRSATLVCASVLLFVLAFVAFVLPVPYVTLKPGPTVNTLGSFEGKPVIELDGAKTYPTDGSLRLTTVSVTSADARVSIAQAFASYFDDDDAVIPRSQYYPEGTDPKQTQQQSADQMSGSKQTSEAAALRAAGYEVPVVVRASEVIEGGPSDGKVQVGDQVRTVDGERVDGSGTLIRLVRAAEPGDVVELGITHDGKDSTVQITTDTLPDAPGVARVGLSLAEDFQFPITVRNNLSEIGGPSAGTMFALAIYDKLEPGDLTGGRAIAGTGEITADGQVLPIGGISQKIAGADQAGATTFLVPEANCAEAAAGPDHGLKLVEIGTLKQAIDSLEKLADDPDAKVPTCQ
ncbi:PDZ domain-containing protein [Solicola sp. PLA-1-18]|uniref:YlbL family protein n=1 Tax=Solicola sp. PLA-1-18 TaxID=3380532 RepID=UPI003B811EF0